MSEISMLVDGRPANAQFVPAVVDAAPGEKGFDLQSLLAPCSGDSSGGVDLSGSGVHDELAQLRLTDNPTGVLGPFREGQCRVADWKKIEGIAVRTLSSQSKDLVVAVHFAESLVKQRGWAGLRDGLCLIVGLIQGFWSNLHPPARGDINLRVVWLEKLDLFLV